MTAGHDVIFVLAAMIPLLAGLFPLFAWMKRAAELDVLSDSELAGRAQQGETSAYGVLVQRYKKRIYAVAYRMVHSHEDADDVAQEAFVRAFQALDSFDTNRAFYTWLCRIAMNLAINVTDKQRRRATDSLDERQETVGFEPAGNNDTAAETERRELRTAVDDAVKALPAGMKEVFILRMFEDMSYEDISETLGIPRGTVMSRLARARERVQHALAPFV